MKKNDFLFISIIIIFGFILYANSLNNSFVWDDWLHIVQNNFIEDWHNIDKIFTKDYFELSREEFSLSWRPLTTLSYFINYGLWGLNPCGYHLSSLLNHLLNAVLVYLITSILFKKRSVSFLAGLFFVSHPVATEAVCMISFNENLLACLFVLLSFYLYIKSQGKEKSRKSLIFLCCISNLFYLLALLSKEVAISLPLIILSYDYCFVSEKDMRKKAFFYLGYIAVTFFYLGIRFFVLQDMQSVFFSCLAGKDFLLLGLLQIIVKFVYFVELLFFPINLCAIPLTYVPETLFETVSFLLTCILLVAGIFSFLITKYYKKIFWCLLWIFLNLLPILIMTPFIDLFSERYLYIPLVGFCMVLAVGMDKWIKTKKITVVVLIFVLGFYSWTTVRRNNDWRDDFTLWSKTVKMHPNNFRAHNQLAYVYKQEGKYDESIGECKKALQLSPRYISVRLILGNIYVLKGEYNQAMREYKKVLELNTQSVNTYERIGDLYRIQGMEEDAIKAYKYALKLKPQCVRAQEALNFYKEKNEKYGIEENIYFYKKIKMLNGRILEKMNFRLVKKQPYLRGEIEKYLLEDNLGNKWLFETYPLFALNVAEINEAVYYWALICGIDFPEVHYCCLPINGKLTFGSVQKFLPDMSSFCDIPTKKLVLHQSDYIQKQHIFDWFILNPDSTKDNFLVAKNGEIVGIDKDSAFDVLNVPTLNVNLSFQNDPLIFSYYSFFWEAYMYKEIDVNFKESLGLINYIQNLDNSLIKEIFKPVFYVYGTYSPSRHEILIARKKQIQTVFKKFYKEMVSKRGDSIFLNSNENNNYSKMVLNKLKSHYLVKEKLFKQLKERWTIAKQENIRVVSSKAGWYTLNVLRENCKKRIVEDSEYFFSLQKGILKGLKEIEKKSPPFCEKLAVSLYAYQVRRLQKEINIEDFEQDLIQHISRHPDEIDVSALESSLRVSYRKPKKSLKAYRELINEKPFDFTAYLNYMYRPMEEKEREEKILEYKNEIKQSLPVDLNKLIYGILKETDSHFLRVYLENDVIDSGWKYCLLGRIYRQRKQYKKELQAYKKGIALNGEKEVTAWLYTLLGIYYEYNEKNVRFGNGFDIDSAMLWFKRAIEINPKLVTARLNLANLFIIKKKTEGAVDQFNEIFKIEPDYANIYSPLLSIINEKKIKKEWLEKIKMNTLDGEAHYIVGLAYQIKGQKRKAKKHFKEARKLCWIN